MADFYTWNEPNSMERRVIKNFLAEAAKRIEARPGRIPISPKEGQAVIGWLGGLLDRKPSEMET